MVIKNPRFSSTIYRNTITLPEGNELYEAVLVGKDAYFVSIDRDGGEAVNNKEGRIKSRLTNAFSIPNALGNSIIEILPRENLTYLSKPFQFESQREIDEYVEKTSK